MKTIEQLIKEGLKVGNKITTRGMVFEVTAIGKRLVLAVTEKGSESFYLPTDKFELYTPPKKKVRLYQYAYKYEGQWAMSARFYINQEEATKSLGYMAILPTNAAYIEVDES